MDYYTYLIGTVVLRLTIISFAIAKWGLCGIFLFNGNRFPALGTNFSLNDDQNSRSSGFQNGCPLCKMAPRCVLGRIPRITGTGKWPPYGGSSLNAEVFHPLERINRVLMHFNGLFTFAWWWFCSTVILLEQIVLLKWGTTVSSQQSWLERRKCKKLLPKYVFPTSYKLGFHHVPVPQGNP